MTEAFDTITAGPLFARRFGAQRALWRYYCRDGSEIAADERLFSEFEIDKKEQFDTVRARGTTGEPTDADYAIFARDARTGQMMWQSIVRHLYNSEPLDSYSVPRLRQRLFDRVFLGNRRLDYRVLLGQMATRTMLVSGGADEMFPTRALLDLGPASGLPVVQIPGLSHAIRAGESQEHWNYWRRFMIEVMASFIEGVQRSSR